MKEDDFLELKSQGLKALADSKEEIRKALVISEVPTKCEVVWLAYCYAETGIGILKLLRDTSSERIGTFRNIGRTKRRKGLSTEHAREIFDSELRSADLELNQSILCFDEGERFEAGLEHARKARDALKLILLESKKM